MLLLSSSVRSIPSVSSPATMPRLPNLVSAGQVTHGVMAMIALLVSDYCGCWSRPRFTDSGWHYPLLREGVGGVKRRALEKCEQMVVFAVASGVRVCGIVAGGEQDRLCTVANTQFAVDIFQVPFGGRYRGARLLADGAVAEPAQQAPVYVLLFMCQQG